MIDPSSPLGRSLAMVAHAMTVAESDWWIIGSAAVALLGANIEPADIDLLIERHDAQTILATLEVVPFADGHALFRSDPFARWMKPPIAVEIMANLHLAGSKGWERLVPRTRLPVRVGNAVLYTPEREEMIRILHRFGRPKDLARAALL